MVTHRRTQIADTAAELFAARGFHGVSVHDIGRACGISGPALYRHFPSKDALLAHMLVDISERLLAEGRRRADSADPLDSLAALVDWHLDFTLTHPALIVVQEREWAQLPPAAARRVRDLQVAYIDVWVGVVRSLRADWDAREARAAVQAVFGLLNSTPHSARLSGVRMRTLLAAMATDALTGP